jgi:phage recombination protein Bet
MNWTTEQKNLLIQQFGLHEATDAEIEYFFEVASRTGADPFRRQIHATMRYDSRAGRKVLSIVHGIDWYRKQAANSGDYAGSDRPRYEGETPDGMPEVCVFTVYKIVQGHRVAFTDEARWDEYAQRTKDGKKYTGLWGSKPHVMLAKVAESRCLRQGWPEQLAGTYVEEEIGVDQPIIEELTDDQLDTLTGLLIAAGHAEPVARRLASSVKPAAFDRAIARAELQAAEREQAEQRQIEAESISSEGDAA